MKLSRKARTKGPDYVPAEPKPRRDPGRPTAYDERVSIATACAAARMGANDEEIAAELGIEPRNLYRWYGQYPEFRQAVQEAKDQADDRVERSLYARATGYVYEEAKLHQGKVVVLPTRMHGDVGAQMNWLKNRRRKDWRDTREVDLVVPMQDGQTEEHNSSDRQLAMAALALFHEVDAEPAGPVIEGEVIEEEIEDATLDDGPGDQSFGSYDEDPGEVDLDFDRE